MTSSSKWPYVSIVFCKTLLDFWIFSVKEKVSEMNFLSEVIKKKLLGIRKFRIGTRFWWRRSSLSTYVTQVCFSFEYVRLFYKKNGIFRWVKLQSVACRDTWEISSIAILDLISDPCTAFSVFVRYLGHACLAITIFMSFDCYDVFSIYVIFWFNNSQFHSTVRFLWKFSPKILASKMEPLTLRQPPSQIIEKTINWPHFDHLALFVI